MRKVKGFTSKLVHAERKQQPEYGAIHQPIHQSVLFAYSDAQDLVDVFQGKSSQHAYARQSSPSISCLQNTITDLEQGHACLVFSSGMAALTTLMLTMLKQGDHLLMSRFVFGNTNSFAQTLENYGIEVSFVDVTNIEDVARNIKPNSRMLFTETIANPVTQVADLTGLGKLTKARNIVFVVDNTMTPAYLLQPQNHQADFIVTSLTKYFGGHANALGGAVVDMGRFDWQKFENINDAYKKGDAINWAITQIKKKGLRDMGACLSSDSMHLLSVGSETMALRLDRSCANALQLANFLDSHPKIEKVYYPGLPNHPQHTLAKRLFKHNGAILSFSPKEGIDPLRLINKLELILCSTHLGDNRTLAIPVAPTIYHEMGEARRKSMGISENMIRLSVGIEDCEDLIADLEAALL
ncbi:cystathionine gamma-synthase family protein [Catenovulum sediminis]|uniref:cystathionine gamma-synthase family protein n=1 Tax=Catenovulum sediminis TaxID=1740262 RepID=UPI00117F3CF7|nr:cystathionine gamma-synthase family protein [Catenovulum sediminis]